MSQKSREDLEDIADINILNNLNKEILASMVREVFADHKDSNLNLLDDELKGVKYNSTQTLKDYLDLITGAVPLHGVITGINVGLSSGSINIANSQGNPQGGIIQDAVYLFGNDVFDSLIQVTLRESYVGRRVIAVITSDADWRSSVGAFDKDNDTCYPVIRQVNGNGSNKVLNIALRKIAAETQNINIEIIIL